jgi:hypothetical protein
MCQPCVPHPTLCRLLPLQKLRAHGQPGYGAELCHPYWPESYARLAALAAWGSSLAFGARHRQPNQLQADWMNAVLRCERRRPHHLRRVRHAAGMRGRWPGAGAPGVFPRACYARCLHGLDRPA